MPWPAGVPCLPWCLELWAGPCRESSEWLAGPNFIARPRAHSTGSMGRIPLFSLSGPDNCWYTPSRGLPCWFLGSSPSGGSSRFWLAWGLCTVLLFPVPPPLQCPEPSVPRTQCQRGRQPCPALPCPVWPCLAMPCRVLVSQVQPGRCPPARHCPVTRPSQSSRTRPPPSRPAVCLCLSSHHHHHHHILLRSCCLPSFFPRPHLASPSPLAQFQWEISRGFLLGLDRPLL